MHQENLDNVMEECARQALIEKVRLSLSLLEEHSKEVFNCVEIGKV